MAITIGRTAWTDDDGSGTTGTVINNAVKTQLYDQIDALIATFAPNAGQFTFPATPNPSASANVLDEYQEDVFTPGLLFGGAAVGMTFGVQVGLYIKIGQLVYFSFRITLTAKGSSAGAAVVTGLPYTVSAAANSGFQSLVCSFYSGMTNSSGMMAYALLNTTTLQMVVPGATTITNMIEANFNNNSDFIISGCYRASA